MVNNTEELCDGQIVAVVQGYLPTLTCSKCAAIGMQYDTDWNQEAFDEFNQGHIRVPIPILSEDTI